MGVWFAWFAFGSSEVVGLAYNYYLGKCAYVLQDRKGQTVNLEHRTSRSGEEIQAESPAH